MVLDSAWLNAARAVQPDALDMSIRGVVLLALAGCFTARTHADRPRVAIYNAIVLVAGAATFALGIEVASRAREGVGPMVGAMMLAGGGVMVIGGATGVATTALDLQPVR